MTGTIGAVVLAAGRSTRMGGVQKLSAPIGNGTVIGHVVRGVIDAGLPPPLVVTGHDHDAVVAAIGSLPHMLIHAEDHIDGMAASIRAGIGACPAQWDGALICLGDMPCVRPQTLAMIAAAGRKAGAASAIVVPRHAGRRGNPLFWGRNYFAALMRLSGDGGARALLPRLSQHVVSVDTDDAGILIDVDTPELLEQARLVLRSSNPQINADEGGALRK